MDWEYRGSREAPLGVALSVTANLSSSDPPGTNPPHKPPELSTLPVACNFLISTGFWPAGLLDQLLT